MKNLLRKEFRLAVLPYNYISLLFAVLLLIPNYPLYVIFFYPTIGFFQIFANGRANNDVMFTALLPVRKSDIVRARCMTIAIFEILQIAASVPFAFLRNLLFAGTPIEKSVFTEPNVAFFGITFVMYALFNAIFIPGFYKTGYKPRFLWPSISIFSFVLAAETLAFIPATAKYIDAVDFASQLRQLPVLLGGIAVFVIGMLLTCRRSIKYFEKVDL